MDIMEKLLKKTKEKNIFPHYVYSSHHGNIYTSNKKLKLSYCNICGDIDEYIMCIGDEKVEKLFVYWSLEDKKYLIFDDNDTLKLKDDLSDEDLDEFVEILYKRHVDKVKYDICNIFYDKDQFDKLVDSDAEFYEAIKEIMNMYNIPEESINANIPDAIYSAKDEISEICTHIYYLLKRLKNHPGNVNEADILVTKEMLKKFSEYIYLYMIDTDEEYDDEYNEEDED